jgi:hypothetical protein
MLVRVHMRLAMLRTIFTALVLAAAVPVLAAQPKKDDAEKAADARNKVICKRFIKTGSLVDGYRTCKTKAEWDRDRETVRASMTTGGGACASNGGVGC